MTRPSRPPADPGWLGELLPIGALFAVVIGVILGLIGYVHSLTGRLPTP